MSSDVQADSPQPFQYSRLPVRWHCTESGCRYPVMSWRVAWPELIGLEAAADVLARVDALLAGGRQPDRAARSPKHTGESVARGALDRAAADAAIALQSRASAALSTWISAVGDARGSSGLSYPFLDEVFAHEAGLAAIRLVGALASQSDFSIDEKQQQSRKILERLEASLQPHHPPNQSMRILAEAQRRGIPFCRISRQLPVYQLGHGFRQRRLWRGFTSATSHLGTVLATGKPLTNDLLRQSGLPVPAQHVVASPEAALAAAQQIGWPVVVKPTNTDYGTAVTAGIRDPALLRDAFELARVHGAVLVERHIDGVMHRLGVIDGKCLWVARTMAPQCESDGRHSVAELAAMMNDARRHDAALKGLAGIDVRDRQVLDTLARQGLSVDDVLPQGRRIVFRPHANVSTGATRENVTLAAHPDNLRLAERAAAAVGLDVAGIDFITPDITRSWLEAGGGICEVNPTPGMPDPEAPGWLLDYLFPDNDRGRIPIVLVIGDPQLAQSVHAEMVRIACRSGYVVGGVRDRAVFMNDQRVTAVPTAPGRGLRIAFNDPLVAAVFICLSPQDTTPDGLDLDHLDLAIVRLTEQQRSVLDKRVQNWLRDAGAVMHQPPVQAAVLRCRELLERLLR